MAESEIQDFDGIRVNLSGNFPLLTEEEADGMSDDELRQLVAADINLRVQEAWESPLGLYKLLFTDEQGRPIVIKDFHVEWNDACTDEERNKAVIESPRESTKTSYLIAYAAWRIGRNRDIRIKWLGPDNETAAKRLAVIHAIVDAPIYQWIFPGVRKLTKSESQDEKRPNSVTMLNVKRDFRTPEPTVQASGILTTGVGGRADEIICDDVVSESNALLNPALRPKVISKFLGDWLNTLVADGGVKYIGTPWHKDDLLGYLKRKSGWRLLQYKHGKPGDPYYSIFPERWPREKLMQRRAELGPLHYARAYLCEAFHEGTVAVKPSSLISYNSKHLNRDKLCRATAIISADPSSGKKLEKGKLDFTGITVFLFINNVRHYLEKEEPLPSSVPPFEIFLAEAYQTKLPHVFQAKLLWQLVKLWQADYLLIEAQGMQSLQDWMDEQRAADPTLPLVQIEPIATGNLDKGQRLIRVTPLLEPMEGAHRSVRFHPQLIEENPTPYYITVGDTPFEAMRDLYSQLVGFPTEHDDILDSFTQGLHWIHSFLVDSPEFEGTTAPTFSCHSF